MPKSPKSLDRPQKSDMTELIVILGDQLFPLEYLEEHAPPPAKVFMAESWDLCTAVHHHKQKILMFLAAMRHYRDELAAAGYQVFYQELAGPHDKQSFFDKLGQVVRQEHIKRVRGFRPSDSFFSKQFDDFCQAQKITSVVLDSPGFLTTPALFGSYLKKTRQPKMQTFYQEQRKRLGILLDPDGSPTGGKWSFDTENRKKLPKDLSPPALPTFKRSHHVDALKPLVETCFANHPGDMKEFHWPVRALDAQLCLDTFLNQRFQDFGPYEDAISTASDFVFHSTLSPAMNMGLITPHDVVKKTLHHARKQNIPIQSTEGFLRQVIGWREFIYGISYHHGEKERRSNFFNHKRRLTPSWYDGTTGLLPLDHCIRKAQRLGYVHHIERLMILSNVMLLAEIDPDDVYQWFMELFVDSAEWVMIPNVYGMGQFADGGLFATKPYIGGSNYLLKMSDFPKGPWCDVMDGLYWRFIERHRDFFLKNPRMSMMAHMLEKIPPERYRLIKGKAEEFIAKHTRT